MRNTIVLYISKSQAILGGAVLGGVFLGAVFVILFVNRLAIRHCVNCRRRSASEEMGPASNYCVCCETSTPGTETNAGDGNGPGDDQADDDDDDDGDRASEREEQESQPPPTQAPPPPPSTAAESVNLTSSPSRSDTILGGARRYRSPNFRMTNLSQTKVARVEEDGASMRNPQLA